MKRSPVWPSLTLVATGLLSNCTAKESTAPAASPVPVASVAVAPATAAVQVGQTVQLNATTKDATGNTLTGRTVAWVSSTPALATVNESGLVTGVGVGGPVTITATSEGKTGTAAITVNPVPVASVAVTPATAIVPVGQTVQLTATTKDANGNVLMGRPVTWASNTPTLATVSDAGLVMGVSVGGPVTITATSEGQNGSAAITVVPVPVATVTVAPLTATIQIGQTVQLMATAKDANGNVLTDRPVTWASNLPTLATVNGTGLVTGVAAGGPVIITATSEGHSGTAAITVNPVPVASVTVSPATATVQVGQTVKLMATTKDANGNVLTGRTVTWASSTPALASVNGSGVVTGVAAGGPVTITATSEGQSGTAAITVIPVPVASVTVTPASTTVQIGRTVPLKATTKDANGNVLTDRPVTWASSNPTLATVDGTGLVTGVAIGGPVTITATSEGQSGTAAVTVTPPSGDLYVSTKWDGAVLHYDSNGQRVKTVLSLGYAGAAEVGGVAVGPDCKLYVSRSVGYAAAVVVYNSGNDSLLGVLAVGDIGTEPGPIAFGSDGSVYVEYASGSNFGTVIRYDRSGQVLNTFPLSVIPTGYMTFFNGFLYLGADFGVSFGVLRINVQTGVQDKVGDISSGVPEGVTFDANGNFYVVQVVTTTLSNVLKVTTQGSSVFVSLFPQLNGGLGRATDLAFGADGNLYVLSFDGNAVLRYHGTDGSFDQAFAAIPLVGGLAGGPVYMGFKPLTCH